VDSGRWHAHVGWIFRADSPTLLRYVPDLLSDRVTRVVSRLFPVWVALGLLLPAVLGGLITLSWLGVLLGFIWGGLVRIFLVHHVTWSINSVCHLWGTRTFGNDDHSRNSFLLGILAFGEGWHNNHHAFPASARHGLRWWQIDTSYLVIRLLALLRLAHNVRAPSPAVIQRRSAARSTEI
jgi:stearoyl-CoA desaturase (delta-9 desaturase)